MKDKKIFNEASLRAMIIEQWGDTGAHIDVFDDMAKLSKGNVPTWISDRADSEKAKEVRRRERLRNFLNHVTMFFFEDGTGEDIQAYNAMVEALREDITLDELSVLSSENMSKDVFEKKGVIEVEAPIKAHVRVLEDDFEAYWWYFKFKNKEFNVEQDPKRHWVWIIKGGAHDGKDILKMHSKIITQ